MLFDSSSFIISLINCTLHFSMVDRGRQNEKLKGAFSRPRLEYKYTANSAKMEKLSEKVFRVPQFYIAIDYAK